MKLLRTMGRPLLVAGMLLAASPAPASGGPGTPALSMSLTETQLDYHVFQRVGNSLSVPVRVDFTGTPSRLQWRLLDDVSGQPTTAWATLAENPTGEIVIADVNVMQGDFVRMQITDGTNTVTGVKRFAVGARWALIGQSNMVFLGESNTGAYPLGSTRTRAYLGGAFPRLGNQKAEYAPGTPFSTYGSGFTTDPNTKRADGIMNLANRLAQEFGCVVLLLPYAVTGSSIDDWLPGASTNKPWPVFKAVMEAIGGDHEGALWLQGENNASTSMAVYKTKVCVNLLNNLHTLSGRGPSNYRFGIILTGPARDYFGAEGNGGKLRAAQLEMVSEYAAKGVFYASTAHDADLDGGDVHFVAASQARQGFRYARAILDPAGVIGPRVSSIIRSGNDTFVKVQHARGTMLRDGAGGNGSALLGFEPRNAGGTLLTYTTSITTADTIKITTPEPVATLAFAMQNAPFGATRLLASVPYDNDTVPGDTLGLPLQPFPAMAVTGS